MTEQDRSKDGWSQGTIVLSVIMAGLLFVVGAGVRFYRSGLRAQPAAPDSFYVARKPLTTTRGSIIRRELLPDYVAGATVWRVLYQSTAVDGAAVPVSALVIVPTAPPADSFRKVVTWAHGAVGVAPRCAPSLIPGVRYAPAIPGLDSLIAAGYVITATDYQGLGTDGPHPFLIGRAEGANVLDAVRAARSMPEAQAGKDFLIWGESQGGHAALFAGQLAATYAPELSLAGVIASAPASDLIELFKAQTSDPDPVGNILISMAITSWAKVYHDATLEQVLSPTARPLATSIANNCIQNAEQIKASVPAAAILTKVKFVTTPPWTIEPWKTIVADNTPGGVRTPVPMLITQGLADVVISPPVQKAFAARLCTLGDAVDYREYPGVIHIRIAQDTKVEMVTWIADRFAARPATPNCSGTA
ncbi:MAG: alpha/beta hydrolase [Gemmatimonadaceae bacterium]|nr:alpha/beta hydrolase [Gemmatimonadaceae bacterium]